MTRTTLLLALTLGLMACSSLTGRTSEDGGPDATDATPPSDVASDRAAPARDVVAPGTDALPCPLGEGASLDPRVNVTMRDTGPGSVFAAHSMVGAVGDADDRVYVLGVCRGCRAGSTVDAAVWRFAANGALDTGYGREGLALEGDGGAWTWFGAAVDAEGRLLAVGYRWSPIAPALARFGPDGAPDVAFNAAARAALPSRVFGTGERLLFGLAVDPGGVLVVGGDGSPGNQASVLAFAARLTASGALDTGFATGGVLLRGDLHGCYDVARDGDGWVLGCISVDDRPALVRLDAAGRVVPWASGQMYAVHTLAPRGFQLRGLRRDSAGRWLAMGAVARVYNDQASPPAAVRYHLDGSPDEGYGVAGVATLLGARLSFAYTFASGSYLGCEDRLFLALALGTRTGVGVFDREGRLMTGVGDEGVVLTPNGGAAVGAAVALVPTRRGDALTMLSTYGVPAFSALHRLRL